LNTQAFAFCMNPLDVRFVLDKTGEVARTFSC
jgi:hypothetical protein